GNYILTRVFLMNQDHIPPYPARTESCGIYVLDLFGLPGGTLVAGMFMAGMTGLILGCVFISFSDAPIKHTWPCTDMGLYALAGILMVGMAANIFGWWILAGLLLFLSILLGAVLIFH
ncbi:MAG TPA: hypothetical protein VMC62_03210, partial [Longilinea sp.]|nr:hypothetical protein [Longilinea sp.]